MALTKEYYRPKGSGAYGDNCPEARWNEDTKRVELRDSNDPAVSISFSRKEWGVLASAFESGEFALPA